MDESQEQLENEVRKLNIILYHRENGLSHPDFQGEIEKSKIAEENKNLKEIINLAIGGIDALSVEWTDEEAKKDILAIKQTLEQSPESQIE